MASKIECGGQTLLLRDANGAPQWKAADLIATESAMR
jgi:hypothetical protein